MNSPLTDVRGIGEKNAKLFGRLGIATVEDLLRFYPRSYDYYEDPVLVSDAVPGEVVSVSLGIVGSGTTFHANGKSVTYFTAGNAGGQMRLTFFNQPYLKRALQPGSIHVFRGMLKQHGNGNLYLEQPQIFGPDEYEKLRGTRQPRYPLTQGLKNNLVIRTVRNVLKEVNLDDVPAGTYGAEFLDERTRETLGLISEPRAARAIHFPEDEKEQTEARNRLAFDEFFFFLLNISERQDEEKKRVNPRPMIETADPERLIEQLPYELTNSQKKAWEEIRGDLCSSRLMNRLLQGDVGSGKTILAFLALLLAASNGRQGALMAPTEVLAEQHMQNLSAMKEKYHLRVNPVLLTGSVKGAARREALKKIADGTADVIIGTHALIQEKVNYKDLGLVITDEQHRFGVRQREALSGKGSDVPILVMSATPIPRTLAIILYGDLDVSLLTDMPSNRLKIRNTVLDEGWRNKCFHFILKEIRAGHQAYIVCPAVEESELEGVANVKDYTAALKQAMPDNVTIEALHGRMKPAEKENIMNRFAAHEIDILVSTTVIEVGINVPNATVMMVENAERFGLSQLHQLRGRVGRGSAQSYCIFLYGSQIKEKPERLSILEQSTDGFYIAEKDLELRGPGDLFGVRQSGELGFVLADIYRDAGLLKKASDLAAGISRNASRQSGGADRYSALRLRLLHESAKSVDFRTI